MIPTWARRTLAVLGAAGAVGIVFQNCATGFNGTAESANNLLNTSTNSSYNNMPFPYQATPNIISFMSCPMVDSTLGSPLADYYYTFKVVAAANEEYTDYTKSMASGVASGSSIAYYAKAYAAGPPPSPNFNTQNYNIFGYNYFKGGSAADAYVTGWSMAPGGLGLTPSFLSWANALGSQALSPSGLPQTGASSAQIQGYLQQSPDYLYAHLQLGVRDIGQLSNFAQGSGIQALPSTGTYVPFYMMDFFQSPAVSQTLGNGAAAQNCTAKSNCQMPLIGTFPSSAMAPSTISASIPWVSGSHTDGNNANVWSYLDATSYYSSNSSPPPINAGVALTVAYVNDNPAKLSGSTSGGTPANFSGYPAGSGGIYGLGYRFIFGSPAPPPLTQQTDVNGVCLNPPFSPTLTPSGCWPAAAENTKPLSGILGVSEFNLANGEATRDSSGALTQWACFQYGIVRYEDAAGLGINGVSMCPPEDFRFVRRDELEIIRKVLPAEMWHVNTTHRCISPTQVLQALNPNFSCYRTTTVAPNAEIASWTLASGANTTATGSGGSSSIPVNLIGHFAKSPDMNLGGVLSTTAPNPSNPNNPVSQASFVFGFGQDYPMMVYNSTATTTGTLYSAAPLITNAVTQKLSYQSYEPITNGTDPTMNTTGNSGIEYRYWKSGSCGSSGRECVNFASFCYRKK